MNPLSIATPLFGSKFKELQFTTIQMYNIYKRPLVYIIPVGLGEDVTQESANHATAWHKKLNDSIPVTRNGEREWDKYTCTAFVTTAPSLKLLTTNKLFTVLDEKLDLSNFFVYMDDKPAAGLDRELGTENVRQLKQFVGQVVCPEINSVGDAVIRINQNVSSGCYLSGVVGYLTYLLGTDAYQLHSDKILFSVDASTVHISYNN